MKFPLIKAPRGLLELFNLKGGAAPDLMNGEVQPTIDCFPFYGVDRLNTANTANAAAAFPLNGTVAVTYPRAYVAFGAQVTVGAAAGTYLDIRIAIQVPSGANFNVVLVQTRFTPYIGGFFDAVWLAPFPLVLPSSAVFNVVAASDAAGADHVLTLKALSYDLTNNG